MRRTSSIEFFPSYQSEEPVHTKKFDLTATRIFFLKEKRHIVERKQNIKLFLAA